MTKNLLFFVPSAVLLVAMVQGQELQGHKERVLYEYDCPFSQLFSHLTLNSCMVVGGEGPKSDVWLGKDCSSICPPDDNGHMRLEGTQLCLQASHGSSLQDGSKMRVYPCDPGNELQQFTWVDDAGPHPLRLKSHKYHHFCATSRGTKATDGDPIILKVCDSLRPVERQFWWGD